VALPVVAQLAQDNEVYGLARFEKKEGRDKVEALGAKTLAVDLASGDFKDVPQDFDYVLHFAVVRTGDFDYDLRANAEGVGLLMAHCRDARAFLHCSTAGVYHDEGNQPLKETDPLGDNHRVMMPTYSLCKIAAESVVRTSARLFNLPTTIARFSVPYGDNGGWPWFHLMMMNSGAPIPVHSDGPSFYNLIHEDDYTAMLPGMLANAGVPATTLNWGGERTHQHRGMVRTLERSDRPRSQDRAHREYASRDPARPGAHARVRGPNGSRLAGRHSSHGRSPQSRTVEDELISPIFRLARHGLGRPRPHHRK
jgi:nucleoside-diphosphate-sugar epimerase